MIRPATPEEANEVLQFFENVEPGLSQLLFGENDIWLAESDRDTAVCLVSLDVGDLAEEIWQGADHIGLRIGTMESDGFRMDLQAALLVGPHTRNQVVRVNEKASRMWIYGKNIIGTSILQRDKSLKWGDACIIVNPRWEGIGIGEIAGSMTGPGTAIRPLHDLGTYLRDQG